MELYENRVVLFIDILGFKNIIKETMMDNGRENVKQTELLKDLIISMKSKFKHFKGEYSKAKMVTQFSDSIVVSFKIEEKEIHNLFNDIQSLLIHFVNNGVICRGAISYGKIIHTKNVLFGPALVDAYETETKAALYPKVILDKSILEIVFKNIKRKTISLFDETPFAIDTLVNMFLNRDTDDKYYIDYFINPFKLISNIEEKVTYNENLRKIIINGLKYEAPDLKVKYGWMKNKYNNFINSVNEKTLTYDYYIYSKNSKLVLTKIE